MKNNRQQPGFAARLISIVSLLHLFGSSQSSAATASARSIFQDEIRPILETHCFKCHSHTSDKIKGGLVLDSIESVLKGGDSGPTIFPGDALASLLFQAIDPGHTELEMPPKREPVSEAERSVISSWINESTAWPSAPTGEVTEEVFNDEDRE